MKNHNLPVTFFLQVVRTSTGGPADPILISSHPCLFPNPNLIMLPTKTIVRGANSLVENLGLCIIVCMISNEPWYDNNLRAITHRFLKSRCELTVWLPVSQSFTQNTLHVCRLSRYCFVDLTVSHACVLLPDSPLSLPFIKSFYILQ